jgi:flagellar hook-associated protein 2
VSGLASGSLNRLADLGITSDRDGKLSLTDATKLKSALADKQSQVEDIFGSTNGIGARLDKILNNFLGSTGVLEQERTLLNSQDKQLKVRIGRIDGQLSIREKGLRVQYTQLLQLQAQLTTQQTSAGLF